jgi:hypothetical protein
MTDTKTTTAPGRATADQILGDFGIQIDSERLSDTAEQRCRAFVKTMEGK